MVISKAAYVICRAHLIGMRSELVTLMEQRGKLPQSEQAALTARIRELLPKINALATKLDNC